MVHPSAYDRWASLGEIAQGVRPGDSGFWYPATSALSFFPNVSVNCVLVAAFRVREGLLEAADGATGLLVEARARAVGLVGTVVSFERTR